MAVNGNKIFLVVKNKYESLLIRLVQQWIKKVSNRSNKFITNVLFWIFMRRFSFQNSITMNWDGKNVQRLSKWHIFLKAYCLVHSLVWLSLSAESIFLFLLAQLEEVFALYLPAAAGVAHFVVSTNKTGDQLLHKKNKNKKTFPFLWQLILPH